MLIRWDTLLIAVAVVGGSVLIENSHRIDTGMPDDEVTASAPPACVETAAVEARSDDSAAINDAAALRSLPSCSDE